MQTNEAKSAELVARLETLPFSKWHRNFFILGFLGVMFDAADFALFGAALPPIAREFGLGPAQSGLLATVGLVGAFVGALFWGTVSDYIGRRTSFSATIGIFALFTGLVATSWNVASLAVFRFLSNFGLGGEVPVTATLGAEFSPGRIRGAMAGNLLTAFPVGLIVAAALSLTILPTFGWRGLFAVGIVPAVLLFFVRRYMPESVRYLLSKGRIAEAEQTVAKIERQALGRERTPDELKAMLKVRPEVAVKTGVTVVELFTQGRARRTILIWIVSFGFFWSSNGILFMLPTILTQQGIPLSQAITYQLVQAIGGPLAIPPAASGSIATAAGLCCSSIISSARFSTCGLRCRAGSRRSSPPSWSAGSIPASTARPACMLANFTRHTSAQPRSAGSSA
jgi:putative MFS transporter